MMKKSRRFLYGMGILTLSLGISLLIQPPLSQGQTTDETTGRETLNVNLRIVPFYAVDKDGHPVEDIKPEEVELRLDGKVVPIAYFDRYLFRKPENDSASTKMETVEKSSENESNPPKPILPLKPNAPRQVFFLVDLAFSTRRGFLKGRNMLVKFSNKLFETDGVHLLTFSNLKGIRKAWGPIHGTRNVHDNLLRSLGLWQTLDQPTSVTSGQLISPRNNPAETLEPNPSNPQGGGTSGTEFGLRQEADVEIQQFLSGAQSFNTHTYRQAAERMAEAFSILAKTLRPVPGPKLLILLSQGIQNSVYFGAAYTETPDNPSTTDIINQGPFFQDDRFGTSFLHDRFRKSLSELTEAGVMTMILNSEGGLTSFDAPTGGENALRHMAKATDGVYIGGSVPELLEQRVEAWTTAYYEASFFLKNPGNKGKFRKIDVVIHRPGVEVWSLSRVRDPRAYRYLNEDEQQMFAIQLIYRGPEALIQLPADSRFEELPGKPFTKVTEKQRLALYEYPWPDPLKKKEVNIFSLVIEADPQNRMGRLVRVDRQAQKAKTPLLTLQEELPWSGTFIWGIVVVNKKDGDVYWHRWIMNSPLESS